MNLFHNLFAGKKNRIPADVEPVPDTVEQNADPLSPEQLLQRSRSINKIKQEEANYLEQIKKIQSNSRLDPAEKDELIKQKLYCLQVLRNKRKNLNLDYLYPAVIELLTKAKAAVSEENTDTIGEYATELSELISELDMTMENLSSLFAEPESEIKSASYHNLHQSDYFHRSEDVEYEG